MTREELEDIWNNKPHGYFTDLRKKKNLSKVKKYTVEARVLRDCGTKTLEVYDTSPSGTMIENARNILRKRILDEFGQNVQISYRAF